MLYISCKQREQHRLELELEDLSTRLTIVYTDMMNTVNHKSDEWVDARRMDEVEGSEQIDEDSR